MNDPSIFHCTSMLKYNGFRYWIAGYPGEYRFTIQTLHGGRVFTSDRYPTIVAANHEARHRLDLVTAALGVRAYESA